MSHHLGDSSPKREADLTTILLPDDIERKHFNKAPLRRLPEASISDKSTTIPCESCKNDIRDVVITLHCQHSYDIACIEDLFTLSIYGEGRLPRCCGDPIGLDFVARFLEEDVLDGLQKALQKLKQEATSSSAEELPKALDDDILAMAWDQGLAQCPGCKTLIERNGGCKAMTCDCGVEFDYFDCRVIDGFTDGSEDGREDYRYQQPPPRLRLEQRAPKRAAPWHFRLIKKLFK